MKVFYPDADSLAGVLLTQPRMMIYEDCWRHRSNLKVVITLRNYIKFLEGNIDLLRYFSLQDTELLKEYDRSDESAVIYKIYPLFVRDVMRAAAAEIASAARKKTEYTDIVYEPASRQYKSFNAVRLKKYEYYMKSGRSYLLQEEAQGRIKHIPKTDEPYSDALNLCMAAIGYSLAAEERQNDFEWLLY